MLKNKAEVIVIGGGVMGTSTAYHLAKLGCCDVVLLEKDQLASGSTGLSVGGIRQQFSTKANIRISQESVKVFERFEEEFETEIDFRQYGYLFLATGPQDWADFQDDVALQKSLGLSVFMITHDLESLYAITDRIAVLADGKVVTTGSLEDMLASDHLWVKSYFQGRRSGGLFARIEQKKLRQ